MPDPEPTMPAGDERYYVQHVIDQYRFDPAMLGTYSSFQTVDDPEFHRLRREFQESRQRLARYVGVKIS